MEEGGPVSPTKNRAADKPAIVNPNENGAAEQPTIVKVKLGIRSQDGTELYYRLPCDKKLKALFRKYCEEKNVEYETLLFLYDGRYVKPTNTATKLGLGDGDIIDALMHQYGGGLSGVEVTGG